MVIRFELALASVANVVAGAVLYNLQPLNGDYEIGPLLAATFMTTQAILGLVYAARNWELAVRRNA